MTCHDLNQTYKLLTLLSCTVHSAVSCAAMYLQKQVTVPAMEHCQHLTPVPPLQSLAGVQHEQKL